MSEDNLYSLVHFRDIFEQKYSWYTNNLAFDYCRDWHWFAGNQIEGRDKGFGINELPTNENDHNSENKLFIADFILQQVLYIDRDHGVVIYQQPTLNPDYTYFRFFDRHGNWQDTYLIATTMSDVITHTDRPNLFIAREKNTNNLLLIDFEPYSISRLPLNFRADFYFATQGGFICANDQGNIAFFNLSGEYLGEIDLQCPIIAIASHIQEQLVVITKKQNKQLRLFLQVEIP